MQSSLASPPLFAGLDDLYEPVDAQQLQDDSPLLLQEEMLDLMNMNPVFGAGDDQTTSTRRRLGSKPPETVSRSCTSWTWTRTNMRTTR